MSRYLNPNAALERLRDEWQKHGKLIIAFDVDSTVIPFHDYEKDDDYEPIRQLLRNLKELGCILICFTAAHSKRWVDIIAKLKQYNIPFDEFNSSPKFIPDVSLTGKVYANAYLDDRAGLYEVYNALNQLVIERKLQKFNNFLNGMNQQLKKF
jgi:hypothetical protein